MATGTSFHLQMDVVSFGLNVAPGIVQEVNLAGVAANNSMHFSKLLMPNRAGKLEFRTTTAR